VAVGPPGILGALPLAVRLFSGAFDRSPRVWRLSGTRFLVERGAPGLIHTDGETHETGATVEIAVLPRSLRMVVPAACRVTTPALPAPTTILPWTRNACTSGR
jgi:diacylglycerol kinase family enzyme